MARRRQENAEDLDLGFDLDSDMPPPTVCSPVDFEILDKLNKDIRTAARALGRRQVAELCKVYYDLQKLRIATGNQAKSKGDANAPNQVPSWFAEQFMKLENDIKRMLLEYVNVYAVGRWAMSVCGIGPVIAAGLITHVDITKAPTVGHIWSFAGLLSNIVWEKGQKRPYNATLKTLCAFKLGESLVKVQSRPSDVYGKLYADRKRFEWARNKTGYNVGRCAEILSSKRWDKTTDAYAWYSGKITLEALAEWEALDATRRVDFVKRKAVGEGEGLPMLPPAHIHAMARRWAVKLFLSHYHHVAFVDYHQCDPPKPYIFEHQPPGSDHRHLISPPNFPWSGGGKSLREMT